MADPIRIFVLDTIEGMATDMRSSWDSALNWTATVDALVDVLVAIGGKVDPDHFAVLIGTAAIARRQSLKASTAEEGDKAEPFVDHTTAAMSLLSSGAALSSREGRFLGGLAFNAHSITEKQAQGLRVLLEKHGLPTLKEAS